MTATWAASPYVVHALTRCAGQWTFGGAADVEIERRGSTVVVPIRGVLGTTWGPSIAGIRSAVRRSVRGGAKTIVLDVDSRGGTMHGVPDLVAELRGLRKRGVRILGLVDGAAAEGSAYWLLTGAARIFATRCSVVGSIGLHQVMTDTHRAYEAKGIDTHVVRSGRHKGVGTPGSRIDLDHLAEARRLLDDVFALFRDDVKAGRGLDDAGFNAVADGRTWLADTAKKLGLVDEITTRDRALARASRS